MKRTFYLLMTAAVLSLMAGACSKSPDEGGKEAVTPAREKLPAVESLTIAQFLAKAPGDTWYHLKGTVKSVSDAHYSQFILEDATGTVSVYGLWDSEGGNRIYDMEGYKIGDAISIAAQRFEFSGEVEARKAWPYDPDHVLLWVSPVSVSAPAGGTTVDLDLYAASELSVDIDQPWVHVGTPDLYNGVLTLTVDASSELDERVANVVLSVSGASRRVRVIQEAYEPETYSIADARGLSFAKVKGTVVALAADGYVLSDATGSLFVKTSSSLGVSVGNVMEVSGNLSTADFLTAMEVVTSSKSGSEKVSYASARSFDATASAALVATLAGKDPSRPGSLDLDLVRTRGIIDGEETVVVTDFDTDAYILNVAGSPSLDLPAYSGKYVEVYGYLASFAGGKLTLIPADIQEAEVESAVTIDGDFSDWAGIEGYSQDDSNAIYGLKVYSSGVDVYMYIRMRADVFNEWGSFKYFAQVYFNIDQDDATGPVAGPFPTADPDDVYSEADYIGAKPFTGVDRSGYIRIPSDMTKETTYTGKGEGSEFYFFDADGLYFYSANSALLSRQGGSFLSVNGTFDCGGAVKGDVAEFEWKFSMSDLRMPRHCTVGAGLRLCHEPPNTPTGSQVNYFIPLSGWASVVIP